MASGPGTSFTAPCSYTTNAKVDIPSLVWLFEVYRPPAWPAMEGTVGIIFLISVAIVVLAIIAVFIQIPFISNYAVWVSIIGYAVLAIGTAIFCL
jgi:hypothetical protein